MEFGQAIPKADLRTKKDVFKRSYLLIMVGILRNVHVSAVMDQMDFIANNMQKDRRRQMSENKCKVCGLKIYPPSGPYCSSCHYDFSQPLPNTPERLAEFVAKIIYRILENEMKRRLGIVLQDMEEGEVICFDDLRKLLEGKEQANKKQS